ncbi:ester cyclase [Streptomyces lincolnensis]|uniref:ester cyclase n=1 Tax=Streptomyces lincolnensis TaxID=1915 RepID=UPI0027E37706|nr:ester cyclase [Streptomyces lincolnensis]
MTSLVPGGEAWAVPGASTAAAAASAVATEVAVADHLDITWGLLAGRPGVFARRRRERTAGARFTARALKATARTFTRRPGVPFSTTPRSRARRSVTSRRADPSVLFHAPVPMGETGARALKRVWEVLLRAFPDIHVAVEDVIAEGDRVVSRNTVTGTHRGEFRGLAPTGRAVRYDEIFVFRFEDGRIAEIWGVVDVFTQLRQLGVLSDGSA